MKISEERIREIVNECVRKIIKESEEFQDVDISKIPIEDLKSAYRDFRLTPKPTSYCDVLSDLPMIKEAFGEIQDPDDVVNRITNRYNLPKHFVFKVEAHNEIYIYIITSLVGINDKVIEEDMNKLGYFLGHKGEIQNIQGMFFQTLQFEPYSQNQKEKTEEIKSKYKILFHWTPSYNLEEITKTGLIPSMKNKKFNYPPRIYLMKGDTDWNQMLQLGQQLCITNSTERNKGEYCLLIINVKSLDNNIKLYYDPNSPMGIYTEQTIPSNCIQLYKTINFFI